MEQAFRAAERIGTLQVLCIVLVFAVIGMMMAQQRYAERREKASDEKDKLMYATLTKFTVALSKLEKTIERSLGAIGGNDND